MAHKAIACAITMVILTTAVFGLYLFLLHSNHHDGCPLMVMEQICTSTTIEHLSLWKTMLASILGTFVVLISVALFVVHIPLLPPAHESIRYKVYTQRPQKPTLLQELFSSGILNRKEPQLFRVFS